METLKWHTETRIINELIPYEHNPRIMTAKQKADLQKSLEEFDLVEIPAINTDNKIIAGHQRLKILQLLGRGDEEIDVRVPNRKLTEDEFKRYNLRSNKNTGDWDWDLLSGFDEDLLLDVGFSEVEFKMPEIIENDNLGLSQNPNNAYGGNSLPIRIGDLIAYIKIEGNGEIIDFLDNFVKKIHRDDEKERYY